MAYIVRIIVMFIVSWMGVRLVGRKSISEMTSYDLAAVMLMTNVAAEPLTYKITSKSIVGIVAIALISSIVGRLSLKSFFYKMDDKPILMIVDGEIVEKGLKDAQMNLALLLSELRVSGYNNVSDIKYEYLEPSGSISIIPEAKSSPVTPEMMDIKVPPINLTFPLVVDGEVEQTNLDFLQKDRKWLEKQLKKQEIKNIENVFLAQYNTAGDLTINLKDREFDMPEII